MTGTLRSVAFSVLWICMSGGGAAAVASVKDEPPARQEATFTVSFEGLMVHVGDQNDSAGLFKQHLAILNAPGHEAMLQADAADRFRGAADLRLILRKGDVVTFNLPSGVAETNDDFRARVRALRPLLDTGSLRDDIQRAIADDGVVAYVKYPSGRLSAPTTFPHPAEYRFGNGRFAAKRCVARTVLFQATTFAPSLTVTVTNTDGQMRIERLRGGATQRVTNLPTSSGDHFHMYKELTSATDMASVHEDLLTYCEGAEELMTIGSGRVGSMIVDSECSNSGYP